MKILTLKTLKDVNSIALPRVNPMFGPPNR